MRKNSLKHYLFELFPVWNGNDGRHNETRSTYLQLGVYHPCKFFFLFLSLTVFEISWVQKNDVNKNYILFSFRFTLEKNRKNE